MGDETGETRTYARQTAPLTRITFAAGDTIHSRDGLEIQVESVSEDNGLLSYFGRDEQGVNHTIDEILLEVPIIHYF